MTRTNQMRTYERIVRPLVGLIMFYCSAWGILYGLNPLLQTSEGIYFELIINGVSTKYPELEFDNEFLVGGSFSSLLSQLVLPYIIGFAFMLIQSIWMMSPWISVIVKNLKRKRSNKKC